MEGAHHDREPYDQPLVDFTTNHEGSKQDDQCDYIRRMSVYGTPWKKSTKLASWTIAFSPLKKRCHQTAKCCSATGVPHVKLEGVDDKGGFWTAKASPYPLLFCRAFAHLLIAKI